jgi:hypothetical protein
VDDENTPVAARVQGKPGLEDPDGNVLTCAQWRLYEKRGRVLVRSDARESGSILPRANRAA